MKRNIAIKRFREMASEKHVLDLDNSEKLLPVLELMLDQAYLGIVFVDPGGVIRFMNQLIHYRNDMPYQRPTDTSQEKGGNRNEEEMYQVYGLEMAMKRFVHSTTIAVFGNASFDRLSGSRNNISFSY
jgi:hypothetical protein